MDSAPCLVTHGSQAAGNATKKEQLHTGIPGNEYADALAKYAVGLGEMPKEEKSC